MHHWNAVLTDVNFVLAKRVQAGRESALSPPFHFSYFRLIGLSGPIIRYKHTLLNHERGTVDVWYDSVR